MSMTMTESALAQRKSGVGIGAMIGSPNGISAKGWIGSDMAIDGAVSFSLGELTSSFYLHSDVLFHRNLSNEGLDVDNGRLDFYYGAGIRLQWFDAIDDIYTGIRGPAGLSYLFEPFPGELFFELVPTVDIHPAFQFSFAGAIGARYYLSE
jgi:hypothetical protein